MAPLASRHGLSQAKVLSITRLNAGGGEVRLFSALKKQGVEDVAQLLWQWAHPPQAEVAQAPEVQDIAPTADSPEQL